MRKLLYLFVLALLISACQADSESMSKEQYVESSDLVEVPVTEEALPQAFDGGQLQREKTPLRDQDNQRGGKGNSNQPTPQKPSTTRKIIKTGNLRMQVEDVEATSKIVQSITEQHDGYISGQNLTSNNYEIRNNFTIRVPIEQFDPLMEAIAGQGAFIKQRQVTSRDVTEEFVDIESRLKTKKIVRERYIEVLRNKAKKVEDILKAEEAIRVVQEEIESREGRLRYLKDQTAMSTINLGMYQTVEYEPEPITYRKSFGNKLVAAFQNGWQLVQYLFLGLINIWPLIIILGLLIWQRKRLFKSRSTKEKSE